MVLTPSGFLPSINCHFVNWWWSQGFPATSTHSLYTVGTLSTFVPIYCDVLHGANSSRLRCQCLMGTVTTPELLRRPWLWTIISPSTCSSRFLFPCQMLPGGAWQYTWKLSTKWIMKYWMYKKVWLSFFNLTNLLWQVQQAPFNHSDMKQTLHQNGELHTHLASHIDEPIVIGK